MKVISVFKWSRNPQDALVGADGSVDWPGVKLAANDDDPAVMEIANVLAAGTDITALTIGDGDTAWAAARGAANTVVVTDALSEVSGAATGAVLAAAIRRMEDVDVVIIGDSSWDYSVVSALTGQLGWTAVAGVTAAEPSEGGLKVTRRFGSASQVLSLQGKAVLAVSASRAEENAPGMREVLQARKKPVEKITRGDLTLDANAPATSLGTRFPDTPPAKVFDGADPAAACEQLMAALRADGLL